METEFENQEDLSKVFEEQITGELPDSEGIQENFSEAAAALEHLNALVYTVGKEGVSQEDYNTVIGIINKLAEKGIDIGMGPALEDFGPSHFTQRRSLINQRVSLEGFGQTVIELIKKAIQALIDYLIKAVRWVRNFQHRDAAIERKVESVLKMIEEASKGADDLIKASPIAVDIKAEMIKYAAELINEENPQIRRNRLTVACYGDVAEANAIAQLHVDVRAACSQMVGSIRDLDRFLSGESGVLDMPRKLDFSWASKVSADMTEFLMDQPFGGYVASKVKPEVFDKSPRSAVQKYEFLLEAYQQSADALRKIRKVNIENDPELANAVTEIITMLNEGYEVLGRAVDFFSRLRYTQLMVLGQYYKFQNRRYSAAWEYVRQNIISEGTTKAMDAIHKRVSEKLKQFAI